MWPHQPICRRVLGASSYGVIAEDPSDLETLQVLVRGLSH
jgi:hypothetical protein